MILSENQERRDIILLQARVLWEMNRWKDSVALFESAIVPPVGDMLERKIQELALEMEQAPTKSTWWDKVAFSGESPHTVSDIIMSPRQAVDFSEDAQAVNST